MVAWVVNSRLIQPGGVWALQHILVWFGMAFDLATDAPLEWPSLRFLLWSYGTVGIDNIKLLTARLGNRVLDT